MQLYFCIYILWCTVAYTYISVTSFAAVFGNLLCSGRWKDSSPLRTRKLYISTKSHDGSILLQEPSYARLSFFCWRFLSHCDICRVGIGANNPIRGFILSGSENVEKMLNTIQLVVFLAFLYFPSSAPDIAVLL